MQKIRNKSRKKQDAFRLMNQNSSKRESSYIYCYNLYNNGSLGSSTIPPLVDGVNPAPSHPTRPVNQYSYIRAIKKTYTITRWRRRKTHTHNNRPYSFRHLTHHTHTHTHTLTAPFFLKHLIVSNTLPSQNTSFAQHGLSAFKQQLLSKCAVTITKILVMPITNSPPPPPPPHVTRNN